MKRKSILILSVLVLALAVAALLQTRPTAVPAASEIQIELPDASLWPEVLLVNGDHALPEDYSPAELVNLYEQKRHFLLAASDIELEREAFEAANRMFKQAEDEGMNGFIVTSGYRSTEKQAELYAQKEAGIAQKPGHSEHETGLAFDVTANSSSGNFEDTEQFEWLSARCWEFGFILRYPKDAEAITGISYEPWHYRYVGVEAAQIIRQTGDTLEEYCAAREAAR